MEHEYSPWTHLSYRPPPPFGRCWVVPRSGVDELAKGFSQHF